MLLEDLGNDFFPGVGVGAIDTLERTGVAILEKFSIRKMTTAGGEQDTAEQNKTMAERLGYAMGNKTDVLVTSLSTFKFDFVLRFLLENQHKHVFKAVWAVNVPWGNDDCAGLGEMCKGVVGATQLVAEQIAHFKDGFLNLTYDQYKKLPGWQEPKGSEAPLDLVDCQISVFVQVLKTFFRYPSMSFHSGNPNRIDPCWIEPIKQVPSPNQSCLSSV